MLNRKGYSLIELLIVSCIGLFILVAAYMLHTGSLKLFKDVKTTADNMQTKMPSMELIGRYFDRWGVGVATGGANCSAYPPVGSKCITVTNNGTDFDQVEFWGNIYGTGSVKSVASGVASVFSCRLSTNSRHNCYYVWRSNALKNEISGSAVVPLALNTNLSPNDADCSALTSTSTLPTVTATMVPVDTGANFTLANGDFISRAPHLVRLYCAANASDGGRQWLYADVTDTATHSSCSLDQTVIPIAPVNRFKVQLQGGSVSTGTCTDCTAARVTAVFRSQSKDYGGNYDTYTAERVFGR